MPLRKSRKYPFPRNASYLGFINSEVGVIRDTLVHEVLSAMEYDVPMDWSRSEYRPEGLFDALALYDNNLRLKDLPQAIQKRLRDSFQNVKSRYSALSGLETISLEEVAESLKLSKSSGAPYFRKKGMVVEEAIDEAISIERGDKKPEPCVAYYRTQNQIDAEGTPNPKVRLVWGYPVAMTLLEGMVAAPALNAVKTWKSQPIFTGRRRTEVGAATNALGWYPVVVSFDWSRYDATLPAFLISWCFDIMRSWFNDIPDSLWDVIVCYFITTPIVMPDGHVHVGKRNGVPSGSYFTSLVGSLANQILIGACASESGVTPSRMLVLGDDSIVAFSKDVDTNVFKAFAESLGMRLKVVSRNYYRARGRTQAFHFLGHQWRRGRPTRPINETLQRIVFMERDNSRAIAEVGLQLYRFEKLLALYADNVDAWPLIRTLIYVLGVGRLHNLELGKRVRHRGGFAEWEKTDISFHPVATLSFH